MKLGLSGKFSLAVTAAMAAVITTLMVIQITIVRSDIDQEIQRTGEELTALLAVSAIQPILNYDTANLQHLAEKTTGSILVASVAIESTDGSIQSAAGATDDAEARTFGKDIVGDDNIVLGKVKVAVDRTSFEARLRESITFVILSFGLTGFLLVGIVALLLQRVVLIPLRVGASVVGRVSQGDLTVDISAESDDEIGHMQHELRGMVEHLRHHIVEVDKAVDALGAASVKTLDVAATTARAVDTQQQETEQVAAAVNEMSANASEVAQRAQSTAEAARQAVEITRAGHGMVSATVESIDSLATHIADATETISELGQKADNISTVLDVITGIAEQTNLLALNAAIEAARAGEQGRGFAVVADEVRQLASRTEESTNEIKKIIDGLQAGARSAVHAMHAGRDKAGETVTEAGRANEALDEISRQVIAMSEQTMQIATAANEQGTVAESINQSINTISEQSRTTAEGTHHTQEAGDELNRQALQLKTLISHFNA